MIKQPQFLIILCASILLCFQPLGAQGKVKVEKLDFSEEDFFNSDGDYLYEGEDEKLPWLNTYDMLLTLKKIKQLVYSFSKLEDKEKKFSTSFLTADVKVVEEQDLIDVDNIFYGYDRYNLPDDAALPPNDINLDNNYNVLYPVSDASFRVVGSENIKTLAGSFDCTVLEVISEYGQLQKLWMIDSMSGVYARVIEQKPGVTGHYWVFELAEIRN